MENVFHASKVKLLEVNGLRSEFYKAVVRERSPAAGEDDESFSMLRERNTLGRESFKPAGELNSTTEMGRI